MGYQESWLYIEPQRKFEKLIRAYEKAEQSGYYEVAGAEPRSVIVLKQPFGDIPAGKKLLWVCGDRGFHCAAGVFGGELKCSGRLRVIPVEAVLDGTDDPRMCCPNQSQLHRSRKLNLPSHPNTPTPGVFLHIFGAAALMQRSSTTASSMKIRVSDTYVKDGREYHGYKIGRVFDVTQTHGKAGVPALSLKDNTPEMDAALRRLLDSSPVPVVTSSTMRLSAYSNFSDGEKPEAPDTGLKLIKLEKGTDTPLSGAIFEVVDPDGATVGTFATGSDGTVTIPLTLAGNYTVYERVAPLDHLLSDMSAQNIKVEYGKVAEITFWNEPYGTLRIEKLSDTGAHLPGAMFVFGNVKAGFAQVETPYIYAAARSGLANNSGIVNVADVGGLYNGQWIQAVSRWLTTVYTKTTVKLPKTGY